MPKLSQIAVGGTLVTGTQFVAVTGGNTDNLYTIDQIKSFVGASPPAGPNTAVQFNNSGALGGDANFEYTTPGQITLTRSGGPKVTFADGTLGSFASIGTDGFGDINIIPTNHNGNVNVQGVSGSGVNVGCLLPTLSQQAVFGLDPSNNPFVALGPGTTNTDTYLGRSAANVWQMGSSATAFDGTLKLANLTAVNTSSTPVITLTNAAGSSTITQHASAGHVLVTPVAGAALWVQNTTTNSPRFQAGLSNDTVTRIVAGLDVSDNPYLGLGPGGVTSRDTFLSRSAANVFQMGSSTTAFDGTLKAATFLGGGNTVTASTPAINITQTWNNAATTFETFLMNVTQTAAGVNSNLMDLKIGGASQFVISNINQSMPNASMFLGTATDPNFQGAGSPSQIISVSDGFATWGMSLLGIRANGFAHGLTQAKTRATTPLGAGAVIEGDQVAAFYFLADDGTGTTGNMPNVARHFVHIDGAVGTNITPGRFIWTTSDHGSSDARFQERIRLDANGYLVFNGSLGAIGGYNQLWSFGATTCTITIASPAVITLANHGFVAQQPVQFSTTGALPTGITAGTTYFVSTQGLTQNTFQINTLPNSTAGFGGIVNTSGTQSGTQSVAAVLTGNNHASQTGHWGLAGVNQLTSDQALKLTQTWNYVVLGTTATSGTGTVATITFSPALTAAPTVGSTIFVSGILPAGYNGVYTVTGGTTTTVTYNNTTTGAQTQSGGIQMIPTMFIANVNQVAGFNGAIADFQTNGVSNLTVQAGSGNTILSNSTSGVALRIYNTVDAPLVPTNYERGVIDWISFSNLFSIGTQAGGTGTGRDLNFFSASNNIKLFNGFAHWSNVFTTQHGVEYGFGGVQGNTPNFTVFADNSVPWNLGTVTASAPFSVSQTWNNAAVAFKTFNIAVTNTASAAAANLLFDVQLNNNDCFFIQYNGTTISANIFGIGTGSGPGLGVGLTTSDSFNRIQLGLDTSNDQPRLGFGPGNAARDIYLSRPASSVFAIGTSPTNTSGWFNYGGQTRVTSDVTFTSTTTLGTVTGLSVNVQAGRNYTFEAHLSFTDAAAGGIQAAISGTCTATNIIYDGWTVDSAANGVKGNTQATALGTAVASTTTTGTAGFVEIKGTITVNAAGTLLVQAAQNTSNATATTVKRGSYFIVQDMP